MSVGLTLLIILMAVGWVVNIVRLFRVNYAGEAGLRIIGIFVPVVGGIVGWLPVRQRKGD